MPGSRAALSLALALTLALPAPIHTAFAEERRDITAMMEAATVWIVTEDEDEDIGRGSGFIVGDGYIVTNAHVVNDAQVVYVLNERISVREAEIVDLIHEYEDEGRTQTVSGSDLALLRFTPPKGVKLPILSFNCDVKRADRISAWGYPVMVTDLDGSSEILEEGDMSKLQPPPVVYTEGTVNAIVRDRLGSSILHSAAIAGGNSGGPLVNGKGEVVGINTWGHQEEDEGAFLNGAQPAKEIVAFLVSNGVAPKLALGQCTEI